jgi:hypothetical protein
MEGTLIVFGVAIARVHYRIDLFWKLTVVLQLCMRILVFIQPPLLTGFCSGSI